MKLKLDENLPEYAARLCRDNDHDVETVTDEGTSGAGERGAVAQAARFGEHAGGVEPSRDGGSHGRRERRRLGIFIGSRRLAGPVDLFFGRGAGERGAVAAAQENREREYETRSA